jgi:hypothetical protein
MKNYHSVLADGENYTDYFDAEYAKKEYPIQLDADESLVGVYENVFGEVIFENIPPELISNSIIITNKAMHLYSKEKFEKIYFKDIQELKGPDNKIDDLIIRIHLKDEIIALPILYTFGEKGKLKDVFEFLSFLGKVSGN